MVDNNNQITLALKQALKKRRVLRRRSKPKHPIGLEKEYQLDLVPFVQNMADVVEMFLVPQLETLLAQDRVDSIRLDAPGDDLLRLIEQMKVQVGNRNTQKEMQAIASRMFLSVSAWNRKTIKDNLKRVIGIDPFFGDAGITNLAANFTSFNTQLITSLQNDTIDTVGEKVFVGFQRGVRAEELAKDIRKYIDPSVGNIRARSNLIARDQVSKLNGQLTQLRQTELGVTRYRWRTVGDDAVRASHAAKNNNIYRWDKPPLDTGHPGDDYQCRCYAEPYLEDLLPNAGLND